MTKDQLRFLQELIEKSINSVKNPNAINEKKRRNKQKRKEKAQYKIKNYGL